MGYCPNHQLMTVMETFAESLQTLFLTYSDDVQNRCLICGHCELNTTVNWIKCEMCSRWVHIECDKRKDIAANYISFSSSAFIYHCVLCSEHFKISPYINFDFSILNQNYSFKLSSMEMDVILSEGKELTDIIINRFGELFKHILDEAYHHHQDVLFSCPNLIKYITAVPKNKKNIQILYGGSTDGSTIGHWICTFFDGNTIYVYNSLKSMNLFQNQLSYLEALFPYKPPIVFPQVQQQRDSVSCGLFAIAFAVALHYNQDLSKLTFNTSKMRRHLWGMICNGKLELFP